MDKHIDIGSKREAQTAMGLEEGGQDVHILYRKHRQTNTETNIDIDCHCKNIGRHRPFSKTHEMFATCLIQQKRGALNNTLLHSQQVRTQWQPRGRFFVPVSQRKSCHLSIGELMEHTYQAIANTPEIVLIDRMFCYVAAKQFSFYVS